METHQPPVTHKPIYKKPLFWIALAAILLGIAVAVCLLTRPKRATVPADAVTKWLDYRDDYAEMPWDGSKEIAVDAFPEVTFRWTSGSVEAVEGSAARTLFSGMPIWSVFFADVTGDGKPELCASVSFGSGMVDDHIIVYDFVNKQSYTLWDRCAFDYHLYTADGALLVGKTPFMGDKQVDCGTLIMHGGVPCCQWQSDGSFTPLNRELHESELLGEWIVEEETDNDGNVLYTHALELWKEYHFKDDGTVVYNETVPISSDSELAFGHPVAYPFTVHNDHLYIDLESASDFFRRGQYDRETDTLHLMYNTADGTVYATLRRMGAESADAPQTEAEPPALHIVFNVGYWTALAGSSLEQYIWDGMRVFAEQNGLTPEKDCDSCHASEYSVEANVEIIRKAIEEQGANVIILSALEGYEAAYRLQFEYPDVQFLALDANDGYSDWVFSSLAPNMLCVSFDAVHEGYLCGYAAVAEGYRNLAFMGFEHWTISREHAAGFAQGAADAAAQLGVDVQVSTEFVDYSLMIDACRDVIEEKFREGVEVIYVPDSYLYLSAACRIDADGNYVNQDGLYMVSDPEYLEKDHALCTTLRRADTVTQFALNLLLENGGKWPEAYAGKHLIVGIESDCVELPEGTYYDRELWRFNNFTVDEYHALIQALRNDPSPLRAAEARVSDAPQTVEEILIGTYVCTGAERNGQSIPVPDEYVGMKIDLGDSYDLGYPTQGGEYFHLATVTVGGEKKTGYDWSVDRDDMLIVWNIETWDTMVFQWYPKEYGAETLRMPVPDSHNGTYYLIFTFTFDD